MLDCIVARVHSNIEWLFDRHRVVWRIVTCLAVWLRSLRSGVDLSFVVGMGVRGQIAHLPGLQGMRGSAVLQVVL
jgi:hypothetical protein